MKKKKKKKKKKTIERSAITGQKGNKEQCRFSELSAVNDLQAKPQENIDGLTKVADPFYFSHK